MTMSKMCPNDPSGVVWALGLCFLCLCPFFPSTCFFKIYEGDFVVQIQLCDEDGDTDSYDEDDEGGGAATRNLHAAMTSYGYVLIYELTRSRN